MRNTQLKFGALLAFLLVLSNECMPFLLTPVFLRHSGGNFDANDLLLLLQSPTVLFPQYNSSEMTYLGVSTSWCRLTDFTMSLW